MHDRRDRGYDRGGPHRGPRDSRDDRGRDDRRGDRREDRRDRGRDEGSDRYRSDCGDGGREDRRGERRDDRRGDRREAERGPGPDTRFLQLDIPQLLFAEAQALSKQAFREVMLEAAKARIRERFGDKITGVAELAVDELLNDVLASLDIAVRIQEHNEDRSRVAERLRAIFRAEDGEDGDGGDDECDGEEHDECGGDGGGDEGHGR